MDMTHHKKTDDIENLKIYGYDLSYTSIRESWPPHYHRALEIIYMIEGEVAVFLNRQRYILKPRDFIVIDSMKLHELVYRSRKSSGVIIEISKGYMRKFLPEMEVLDIECIGNDKSKEDPDILKVGRILHDLSDNYKDKNRGYMLRSSGLIMELMDTLTESFSQNVKDVLPENFISQMERLGKIIDYAEDNYQNSISLQEAADYLGLNKEYFCRYFKHNMGYSFMDYLSHVRLNHIYQDLVLTNDPVYDIIDRNGYTNRKLFYSKFKEKYGLTPGQIRKTHESNEVQMWL